MQDNDIYEKFAKIPDKEINTITTDSINIKNLATNGIAYVGNILTSSDIAYAREIIKSVREDSSKYKKITFSEKRLDVWDIPELNKLIANYYNIIDDVISNYLNDCKYVHKSTGLLLLDGQTDDNGKWHRDTSPGLFKYTSDCVLNDSLNVTLPDYYYNILFATDYIDKNSGATEFIMQSFVGLDNVINNNYQHVCVKMNPGDVIIFNGKMLHRAKANKSNNNRDVIYNILCAEWYLEENL